MAVALPARLKAEDIGFFIPACLRGDALKWHSNELSKDKRTLLARARDCEEWTIELVKRFKMKTSTSLIKIYQTTYGLAEARRGVLARQHANNILKLTKSDTSTIEDYLNDLDDRQETWDERAQRGYRRPSPPPSSLTPTTPTTQTALRCSKGLRTRRQKRRSKTHRGTMLRYRQVSTMTMTIRKNLHISTSPLLQRSLYAMCGVSAARSSRPKTACIATLGILALGESLPIARA